MSQGVAIAAGLQEEFNWKAVGMSAVGAGVTAGVGGYLQPTEWLGQAAVAAGSNALTQGLGVLTGLQDSFHWTDVAAAAVAAPLANKAGAKFAPGFQRQLAAGITGSLVRAAFGGKIDATTVLVDAFGNAFGNSIVDRMSPQPAAGARAVGSVEDLQEVGITPRYVGPGSEVRNARLDNNPINVIRSGSDGMQSSAEVLTTRPSGPEEIVVTAQRLTVPQERLYDRLISP